MLTKAQIRKTMTEKRSDLLFRAQKDCKIAEKVVELLSGESFASVFSYVSLGSEADTHAIIRALAGKVRLFVPHTEGQRMFTVPADEESLSRLCGADGKGNIFSAEEAARLCCEPDKPCAAIVPMLAFSPSLYRIGYGGGYYDRWLAGRGAVAIGIAYDEQEADFAPDAHDIRLNAIVTPTRILGGI